MTTPKSIEILTRELEVVLRRKAKPVFEQYGLDFESLLTPLKWKPMALVIGNYSSGKSTFINELLATPVQRTGQAPTDDSFTILTAPEPGKGETDVPGNTLVRDERLPFAPLADFGESLLSHLYLKRVDVEVLENMAIIDTPGMLDSVTEKDRGYNYLGVVGQLARLSDIIILMFDPLKAGTIKETFQAIRSTLPGSTSEDRIMFVLNRIDECDNITDLVRSYGTLCWNLSQMTGRKDLPRIYLTYAPGESGAAASFEIWQNERHELMEAVKEAPKRRLNHILQDVDRDVRGLQLEVEALAAFKSGFGARLRNVLRYGALAALLAFLFGDAVLRLLTGYPQHYLLEVMVTAPPPVLDNFIVPAAGAVAVFVLVFLYLRFWTFPRYVRKTLAKLDELVVLDDVYRQDLWCRVQERVRKRLSEKPAGLLRMGHKRALKKLGRFVEKDLKRFYQSIQAG